MIKASQQLCRSQGDNLYRRFIRLRPLSNNPDRNYHNGVGACANSVGIHQPYSWGTPLTRVVAFASSTCSSSTTTSRPFSSTAVAPAFAPSSSDGSRNHDEEILNLVRDGKGSEIFQALNDILIQEKTQLRLETFHKIATEIVMSRNNPNIGFAAEELLSILMDFHNARRLADAAEPDVKIFNLAMSAWVRSGHAEADRRAECILDEVEALSQKGILTIQPDAIMYTSVMKVYAIQGKVKESQAILDRMWLACKEHDNESARPNVITMSTMMDAHARSGSKMAGVNAEACLNEMIDQYYSGSLECLPNTVAYNTVIKAYANAGDPKGAHALLDRMYKAYKDGIAVDAQPNRRSFGTVLHAYSQSLVEDGAKMAEDILNRMVELHDKGELTEQPDVSAYWNVISAYAKVGNAQEAMRVFERMLMDYENGNPTAEPNFNCCNALLEAWSKSDDNNAGGQAEAVLSLMIDLHASHNLKVKPDVDSYNFVINAWAEQGNAERANMVFERMAEDFKNGNKMAKPNITSFKTLLKAWAVSMAPTAGAAADVILNLIQKFNVRPDRDTYDIAIMCWESSRDVPKAQQRLRELRGVMKKHSRIRYFPRKS
jgi:pentatricopeptide repeat protein